MLAVTSGRAPSSILSVIMGQHGDSRVPAYSSIELQLFRSNSSIVINEISGVFVTKGPS